MSGRKRSGAPAVTGQLLIYETATICLGLALLITVTACGGGALGYNGVLFFHVEEKLGTVWRRWCCECMSLEQRQQLKQVEGQEKYKEPMNLKINSKHDGIYFQCIV